MVTLANINGASLTPDLSGGLGVLFQAFGTPQTRAANRRAAEFQDLRLEGIKGALGSIGNETTGGSRRQTKAIERLAIVAPQAASALQNIRASGDAQARETFRFEAEKGVRQAELVSRQKDFAGKQRAIQSLAAEAAQRGEPLDRFIELQNKSEPELDLELERMKVAGKDIKAILGPRFETVTDAAGNVLAQRETNTGRVVADPRVQEPQTVIGQARADLERGLITQSEFNTIKNAPRKAQSDVGKLIADRQSAVNLYAPGSPQLEALDAAIREESSGKEVKLSDVNSVRGQFTKLSGDFIKIRDSIAKVRSAAANPSAAGDLALIFNFMKILDPGSVVRESEFATAQNAAGVPERIRAAYNRALEGELLTTKTREDFTNTANRLFESQVEKQKGLETAFRAIAERSGINPDNVVIDFRGEEAQATVNIGGEDVAVGTIITNSAGQRGRVEADGTITVLE